MRVKREIYIYFDDLDEAVQKELLSLFGFTAETLVFKFTGEFDDSREDEKDG